MVWEPFLLAIGFGLMVSAGIYFAILWPRVEPLDDEELAVLEAAGPAGEPAAAVAAEAAPQDGPGEREGDAVS